ncbi:PREDICTED: uncharacterized protein LOC109238953 [Nicotiana attenuata]|uniref:Protein networked 2a n=1 Tax=Nicotiana attenuata TaxID=49451 RepID=A0A314LAR1_NICAT|nr:PREDICTED: uncharacterized protein LOC109238953 [Nicotiana attenuata]OIT38780.1 protein networked 2a [Nicotiana attenuata]
MLHRAARNAYSWWWASHIRTKQSKWLDQNLQDMEEKVEYVLKIIDEDGESFASRAEMYYRRRPELLNFVEDFFRSYRALAERFDHLSKDLQTANRTIATVYPERVQLSMEDEDGEHFLAAIEPHNESNDPPKSLPAAPKLSVPKVPSFAKRNAKPSRLMSKKGLIKFNVDDAIAAARPTSGLKKSEALQEIDRLQKEILGLQTEKEFIKSSYENGLARYWEIEEHVTEMQTKVSSLQDEFGIGTMIEDEEARTLMTATALNSCQDTLARLQEKQKQSVEDVIAEHQKILEVLGKFETLKGKFVSHLPHPQVLSEVNKSSNPDSELKKLNRQVETSETEKHNPEKVHSKVKELQANSATSSMSDLAEKVDELVDKVIYLESALSSQNAYVNRLRAETNELHSHLTKAEEEKGTLVEDSGSMSKRIRQLEEELLSVQNLKDYHHQPHLTEASCSFDDLSEKLHNKRKDEDVKDTLPSNKVIGVSGVDKAEHFQAQEATIPGANVLGSSKGISSKDCLKKEVLQEQEGCLEVDQQNFVKSHLSNDARDGQTGVALEANQGVSSVYKAKQFQVHETIIAERNVLGISKGVSTNDRLKKEGLQQPEGYLEDDQQNYAESHSSNDTQDGKRIGTLEANYGVSGVDKAKQFQVHEAVIPRANVQGISKGVCTNDGLKKEGFQQPEGCPEDDQQNYAESHSSNYTRDGKRAGTLEANHGVSGVDKAKQFQVHEAVIPGENVLRISKGVNSKEGLKKEVVQQLEGCLEDDHQNHVGSHLSNDSRDGQTGGTLEANQGSGLTDKEMMTMTTPHLVASEGVRVREKLKTDICADQDHSGKAEYTMYTDSKFGNAYNSFQSEDAAASQQNYYKGTEYNVKSPDYDAMISKQIGIGQEAKKQDNLIPFEDKEEKFPKADLQNDQDNFPKNGPLEEAADVGIEKGFDRSQHGHVEQRWTNDTANRSDDFPGSAPVNQKKDSKESECVTSPGCDAMISKQIRMGEEAKKQDIWDNLIKGKAEKLSISDLQYDHDDLTKTGFAKDAEEVEIEKGFGKCQDVHVTDHGSATRKNVGKVEQTGTNYLADRRDDFPSSIKDKEEKFTKTNHQNHLNDFFQDTPSTDSPDVNIERGFVGSESFLISNDDLATKRHVKKEKQAGAKDAADKHDHLNISVEGKEEKLYKTYHQNYTMNRSQNSPLRNSPEAKMEMSFGESEIHVSDNESAIRRDMRMEEHAGTTANAEKSDCSHIPPEGKEENIQKSNHPINQYDLPIRNAAEIKMEKAFRERERINISDDFSAIREERTDELAVRDDPHAEMEESDKSRSLSSSNDSAISKDVRVEQQASRINVADKCASSTSEEGKISSDQGSYFNDLLQVSPSGATQDEISGRGFKENVHTTNPPRHDSIFFKDAEIQLQKLEYDPSNSENYRDNIQVKGQGSTLQKSTPEKSYQDEGTGASISGSGTSIGMDDKGREKVGDDHDVNVAVGSATESFSKLNESKQSEKSLRKIDFRNNIKSEEQTNDFIQVKTDGDFPQTNWHNQLEKHSAKVQVRDIPSTGSDNELEEWESILDNLPSVLKDSKREDVHKDEFSDQGNQEFRTVHNGLYMEQDESGLEDDQPNWRELFLNSLDDREKILLEEYTSVLRNFKGVKKKLNDAEKKRRASHFQYVVQMKVLKNANALKDAQILSLQHRLNLLQSKDVETEFLDKALSHSTDMRTEETAPEETRILDIGDDDGDIKVTDVDETHSFTTVEEKVRMDIDDLLEENIELWLRFSTSFHQLHKFQTSVQDLQAEIKKVKEECNQDTGQPQSLLSGIRPIYRHLREIQTELTLWLDHNAMLKDDLQHRLSSLSNILDVITRLSKSGSKENDPVLNAYQAAKFQGEILNMKQENNKLAGELEVAIECIRKLQDEIRSTLSNLDEELGLKNQQARPRSRIPLRSFLFGVKLKNKRPSIFSCVNPALQKQYSDLTAVPK